MPASLKRALADPFAWGNHPDIPWRLPDKLPPTPDLVRGAELLQAQLARVDRKHAAYCLGKLLVGFNERKTADETKLLLEVWLEACGDVPNDLWSAGILELLKTHKFGMPKPPHFREAVDAELKERQKHLKRAQEMLDKARETPKPAAFVREPQDVRIRGLRDSFRRIGKVAKAASYERQLAEMEGRDVEDWARDPAPEAVEVRVEPPTLPPLSPEMQALTKLSVARSWRNQGNEERAQQLEAQARELAPHLFEAPAESRDVPSL